MTRGVRSRFFNITKSVTDVYGGLSTIPVLSDVYASTFDEFGDSTNQRSAMPDADWRSARDERGGDLSFGVLFTLLSACFE